MYKFYQFPELRDILRDILEQVSSINIPPINTLSLYSGIVQRIRRANSYRYKRDRDRDRDRDGRRQLSADARPFHFSGNTAGESEDGESEPLPYHRHSLGERLYPRVHSLQPVSIYQAITLLQFPRKLFCL